MTADHLAPSPAHAALDAMGRLVKPQPFGAALTTAVALAIIPAALTAILLEPVSTLLIPVALALFTLLPLGVAYRRAATAVAVLGLAAFAFLALLSVGIFFVPAVVAMLVAHLVSWRGR